MRILFFSFLLLASSVCCADPIPRKVLTFYNSKKQRPNETTMHYTYEMPFNHLGLDVIYFDINEPLPDASTLKDYRGVVTCFEGDGMIADTQGYLEWGKQVIDAGKLFVILEDPGFEHNSKGEKTPINIRNDFYSKLGVIDKDTWIAYTYDFRIAFEDPEFMPFERKLPQNLPRFNVFQVIDPAAKVLLSVERKDQEHEQYPLIVVSKHGALVPSGYSSDCLENKKINISYCSWYINLFHFFAFVFGCNNGPIPDTTTLAGRRIFYSHIDGDAWNSVTKVPGFQIKETKCTEILYEEVLKPNPDIPVTVGPIAADINPTWAGSKNSQDILRRIFALPQVEGGSHTYSHPFEWEFFEKPNVNKREVNFLELYPYGSWQSSFVSWANSVYQQQYVEKGKVIDNIIPRAYANEPFNLKREISGSIDYINGFMPEGKKVQIMQWSGDCHPWATPIKLSREMKVRNINGGFVQFDEDCPSYACVGPLGRKVGNQQQIYASANNENIYTFDWTKRFYGFKFYITTIKNTESPIRVKPINIYYHCYSGELIASVNAVKSNIEYVRSIECIPVWASRFCAAADGFFTAKIDQLSANSWQFFDRDGLDTIRFDAPLSKNKVDFNNSKGVLGYREYQNSLYVALDKEDENPIITLTTTSPSIPYLRDSSWEVWGLKRGENSFEFKAEGFGDGVIRWKMPEKGIYHYTWDGGKGESKTDEDNLLELKIPSDQLKRTKVNVEKV